MIKRRILIIFDIVLGVVVLGLIALMIVFTSIDGQLYLRSAQTLDLRSKDISVQEYESIREEFPKARIQWNIPFQGSYLPSDTEELAVTSLSDEDVKVLSFLPNLKLLAGNPCTDYLQLAQLQRLHPEAQVLFQLPLQGRSYDQDTTQIVLKGLTAEEAALLDCFSKLEKVEISDCTDYAMLMKLQEEHPQWQLSYTVLLGEQQYPWDSVSLDARAATQEQLDAALSAMPDLRKLHVVNPVADGEWLLALREQYPELTLTWELDLFGAKCAWDAVELDISGAQVESCQEVETAVACLPYLEKLIMSDCGIDNETMATFREEKRPDYKVVWTVYLSDKTKARTDDIYFMPIQQGEYYFMTDDAYNLRYCEDMICLDLGHHMIRNIDFVEFMPHLKYLILAHGGVRDISPIVHCQELIYLEVDWSELQDYTPIAQLKSLEDLNINKTYCDITPLLEMTWLKTLWAPGRSYKERMALEEALPNTRLVFGNVPEGEGWRNLQNYYDMRDILGMPYMK